jgi:hypothetical protein
VIAKNGYLKLHKKAFDWYPFYNEYDLKDGDSVLLLPKHIPLTGVHTSEREPLFFLSEVGELNARVGVVWLGDWDGEAIRAMKDSSLASSSSNHP